MRRRELVVEGVLRDVGGSGEQAEMRREQYANFCNLRVLMARKSPKEG